MKCSRRPGAQESRPISCSRAISAASVTSREGPMAVTLQPERYSGSTTSASNATIARAPPVAPERDDRPAGRRGELAAAVRPDDDVAVCEGEVDQFHGGQC